jgi:hypothetical protein
MDDWHRGIRHSGIRRCDLEAWLDEARAAWRPGDTRAATLRRMSDAA